MRAIVVRGDRTLMMYRNKFGNEYFTLVGGGVDFGETKEQALARELKEEAGFDLTSHRLVFVEDAGSLYGPQYMYLCEVDGDDPVLSPDTEEAKSVPFGNIYQPKWMGLDELSNIPFRSENLKRAILHCAKNGWPEQEVLLNDEYVQQIARNRE